MNTELIPTETTTVTTPEKKMDECIELKKIEYQTMLLHKNNSNMSSTIKNNNANVSLVDVNKMLDQEQIHNTLPWSRLTKAVKMTKLYEYVDSIQTKHDLTKTECDNLKAYIKTCVDRKQLQRAKQICYDKQTEMITDIPSLIILSKDDMSISVQPDHKEKKRFTLKTQDVKNSTLKNLSKGKSSSKEALMKHMRSRKHKKPKESMKEPTK